MTMQKRHFEIIAATIRSLSDAEMRRTAAYVFADRLASTNAKFKRGTFLEACGVSLE